MTGLDILKKTRELFADPNTWQKGNLTNEDETQFCVLGGMLKVSGVKKPDWLRGYCYFGERNTDDDPAAVPSLVEAASLFSGADDPFAALTFCWRFNDISIEGTPYGGTYEKVMQRLNEVIAANEVSNTQE